MKLVNKKQSVIPELVLNDEIARSEEERAEALNAFFTSCFNNSCSPPAHVEAVLHPCVQQLEEVYSDPEEVLHLLLGLQATKASGPDQISASILLKQLTTLLIL